MREESSLEDFLVWDKRYICSSYEKLLVSWNLGSSTSSSIGALKVSGLGQSRPLKKIKHVAVHAVAETDVYISLSYSLRVDYGFSNSAFWLTWICNFTRDGRNSPPYISSDTPHRLSELFLLQACHEQRSVEARVWKETFVVAPVSLDCPVFQRACSVDSYRIWCTASQSSLQLHK